MSHRHPKDKEEWLEKFYQSEYHIDTHLMTSLPGDEELKELMKKNFPEQRDYRPFFKALHPGTTNVKVVDFGSSWGYDVYNLKSYGYEAMGYEISKPRAKYGIEKLGVHLVTDEDEISQGNDIIFSSHVIEHLYSIGDFVNLSKRKLNTEGYFVAFCPNGNLEYKKREPAIFKANWGSVHPFYLDFEFAEKLFHNNPFLLMTGDWEYNPEEILQWDRRSQVKSDKKDGKELLIIARPNISIK